MLKRRWEVRARNVHGDDLGFSHSKHWFQTRAVHTAAWWNNLARQNGLSGRYYAREIEEKK